MFLQVSLFAFILVLFWLWLFSRLFCDVRVVPIFLFLYFWYTFYIFDCHQFWDSYADYFYIFDIHFTFLIVTSFEIHMLIVDVCVCLSPAVVQYI